MVPLQERRMRWSRFFVPDPSFSWYVRSVALGVVGGLVIFGGLLWRFHYSLLERLGVSAFIDHPEMLEVMIQQSRLSLEATGIAVIASGIFVIVMSMYLLHRIAGPVYSLKRHMRAMLDGETPGELRFRNDDQLQDLADLFNQLMRHLGAPQPAEGEGAGDAASDQPPTTH
jgi:hypothetical protein